MIKHLDINDLDLRSKIKLKEICLGGNRKLKIFGTLQCKSGKRMKRENRVFFVSEKEAIKNHFRPCGHCMKIEYKKWIYSTTK
jgi:methylphosphotriester-DNA--protein-cysteine methyltransferase